MVSTEPDAPRDATPSAHRYPKASSWVGWIAFAAVCMLVLGIFHFLQGLVAIVNADYYPVTRSGPVTDLSLDAWGWLHVIGGVVLVVAGLCVFAGQAWARAVGVVVAVASLVTNFGFLGAYPILSLMMIGLDVVIIMALTVHGSDIKP
jgi:hypothetical protein